MASFEGVPYCRKHYIQIIRHGIIKDRTIYDANEYAAFSGLESEEGSGRKYFVHRYVMHLHDKKI